MSGIRATNLVKQWDEIRAVDDVSFETQQGSLTVLLGPSGCGKSTILRMIAGLEEVSAGTIQIDGQDVTREDPSKRGVSMVFQSYALFPHLSVRENILFGLKVRKVPKDVQERRLNDAARMVGLDQLLDRRPANLSGGQRQRVALTRTIVSEQPVCLMDEPLSNLDAKLRAEMRDEICTLQRKLGLTMLYVTHDQIEAMSMADQVVLLQGGKIEQHGTPAELYEAPQTTFAARFLGMPPMNILAADQVEGAARMIPKVAGTSGSWQIGIRPENIHIAAKGLAAEVGAVDYMGAETVLRLKLGSQNLMARVNGRASAAPGETVNISWKAQDVHLFDEHGIRRTG
ncbi:MAG: ABC transporter ATP-binding protein [Alphaproteobacteria bacterium]|nr:ABC transporter ATP-binding protein [Alphaproteobacteria bacterium]